MGGFTSAPPIWVGKDFGAKTFLHESNTIPGRANRFLARFVDEAFVGFSEAGRPTARAQGHNHRNTGAFAVSTAAIPPPAAPRLGLNPIARSVLIMGGSQGASGINEMILSALPLLAQSQTGSGFTSPAQTILKRSKPLTRLAV